jgi:hypothetical protein
MLDASSNVQVTPWLTREATPKDLSAPMHDCLWQIAQEQAVLKRMKDTGEDWNSANGKVTQQDLRGHLDVICDDNGFKRIDGSGKGRDPDVIRTGENIKVRIDPAELNEASSAVTPGQASQAAYNRAVAGADGKGVDINKKNALDDWIAAVPGFPALPDKSRAALIDARGREGVDAVKLGTLGGSRVFASLEESQQQNLLARYGSKDKAAANAEVERLASLPPDAGNLNRLAMVGSGGFYHLNDAEQKQLLDRYSQEPQFRDAVDRISKQPNFRDKDDVSQANALELLRRYSTRTGKGYGAVNEANRSAVLLAFYDEVLVQPDFKLNERQFYTPGISKQNTMIDAFARDRAPHIRG